MENYLEKLCINLGIKLIYVNNKIVLLSCDIKNSIPIIRAHKLFKKCSEEVAVAILGYYTDSSREKEYEKIIKEYIKDNFSRETYKIKSPIELFKSFVTDIMPFKNEDENDLLIEFEIASMVVIEPSGVKKQINPIDELKVVEDNVLEMGIVVSPPLT